MGKHSGMLRLIVVSVCCLTVLIYSGCSLIGSTSTAHSGEVCFIPASDHTSVLSGFWDESVPAADNGSAASSQEAGNSADQPVTAAASGTVAGKVLEKFITPYTANTSYGNIYVKNSTDLSINLKTLINATLPYKIAINGEPQVLILHTHATESFLHETRDYYTTSDLSRTRDSKYNMIHIGNTVTDKLNAAGVKTLHDTTLHDYPSYNESYNRAAATIRGYLKKYPSIKIVIDLHRDAIASGSDKVKPVTEINGKKAAQVMLVMGSQSGSVTGFPKWKENLKLAVRIQQTLESMYPTLARSLSLMSRCYNEHLTTGSVLIEVGSEANSIEEVSYTAELLGNALAELFPKLK